VGERPRATAGGRLRLLWQNPDCVLDITSLLCRSALLAGVLLASPGVLGAVAAHAATTQPPRSRTDLEVVEGGVVRGPRNARRLALIFTGHEFAEGGQTILETLARREARASFFLTGAFLDNPAFAGLVKEMVVRGHYVGPHSDAHILYCPWDDPKRTLVSREGFVADLEANLAKLSRFGLGREAVTHFVPPYEWYNAEIAAWASALGLRLVNFTRGTRAAADYTGEADPRFVSSEAILRSVFDRERADPNGLDGFLLLMHVGAGPARRDKLHDRLDDLLGGLARLGYAFVRVDELVPASTPGAGAPQGQGR
jgi:endoglucanase